MNGIATWKVITVGAALGGLSLFGVATANAAPALSAIVSVAESTTGGSAHSTQTQTDGMSNPSAPVGLDSPFHSVELPHLIDD